LSKTAGCSCPVYADSVPAEQTWEKQRIGENHPISKYLLEDTEGAKYCYGFFLGNELKQNFFKKVDH